VNDKLECPRCSEITLVGHKDGNLITYTCICGHEENRIDTERQADKVRWEYEQGFDAPEQAIGGNTRND